MTDTPSIPKIVVVLGAILTLIYPILTVLIMVRLVMSPLFLQIEYNRSGFPDDYYGFTREDRLTYAPYALDYLINGEPLTYLSDLTFADGSPLYNARELEHMDDVQAVTRTAFLVAILSGLAALAITIYLARMMRNTLIRALRRGAVILLVILASIIILVIANWDRFFTLFHQLFFAEGTWVFLYSDTLIRLFPEQFWFDAAITIGGLSALVAVITLVITRHRRRALP